MSTGPKKTVGGRSTDRVREALSTLAALLDRTINELKSIDTEFEERLLEVVRDTETSLQSQTAQRFEAASTKWESERSRLNAALERTAQMGAEWEGERGRLKAEIEQLKEELAAANAKEPPKPEVVTPANLPAVVQEMERVESAIKEISRVIEDPESELSVVIRKNVERAELESYLRGIRFAYEQR